MALLYAGHPRFRSVGRFSIQLLSAATDTRGQSGFLLENPAKNLLTTVHLFPFYEQWFQVISTVLQTKTRFAVLNRSIVHPNSL